MSAASLGSSPAQVPSLTGMGAVALAYFLASWLGRLLVVQPAGIAALWPASGLALAVLLVSQRARWPALVGIIMSANLVANLVTGVPLLISLGFGLVNGAEPALAAWLLGRLVRTPITLQRLKEVLALGAVAVGSSALAAGAGALVASWGFGASLWQVWRIWWVADGVGILMVAPALLTWATVPWPRSLAGPGRIGEALALGVALVLVTAGLFGPPPAALGVFVPLPYLVFPLLFWTAWRFGPRGVGTVLLLLAVLVTWYTVRGMGPFAAVGTSVTARVLSMQLFLSLASLSTLLLAAVLAERQAAEAALQQANTTLEQCVLARTDALERANAALRHEVVQRQQAETAERAQREWWQTILASIGDAVIVTDTAGRVRFLNAVAHTLTGWAPDEANGQPLWRVFRIVHEETRQPVENPVAHVIHHDSIISLANNTVLSTPDGEEKLIDTSGAPIRDAQGQLIGVVLVFRDITARRQAEEALQAAQEQLRLITDNVPALIAYLDRDERYRFVNAAYERNHGIPRAQFLGRTVRDLLGSIYEHLQPYLARALAGEAVTFENLYSHAGAPALQVSYVPDLQPDGQVAGVYVLITDITALKQAQAELVRLNRELAQREVALRDLNATLEQRVAERTVALQQAMAERQHLEREAQRAEHFALLGRLAAGVSHELRNPLGAVFLHVDLLAEELAQPSSNSAEAVAEALTEIKTNLARVDDLIQDYLSLVRVHTIQPEIQDLGAALDTWVADFQTEATAHGMRLVVTGLADLEAVAFHASTLRRALLNLVQNALEAMAPGGTVTLRGQGTPTEVRLQVCDTGCGIPAAQLAQIFEPLYTTKPGGTGLGLYIVQEIVAAQGGQVTVESVVGQGTTVTLTLPRVVASAQGACTPPAA